jgi:dTDP-4-dehydrorhamnose reductase
MSRILLTGATGQLGPYLLRRLTGSAQEVTAWSGTTRCTLFGVSVQPVDLANRDAVAAAFAEARPHAVIHAAAMSSIADCYRNSARAAQVNTDASGLLAELAAQRRARFFFTSTDLVFDGERGGYAEEDPCRPLSSYGSTKLAAEAAVRACPGAVVARLSWLVGPSLSGRGSFFDQQVQQLRAGMHITSFADEWRTPLGLDAAAAALLALMQHSYEGLIHIGGPERLSRLEVARCLARRLGVDAELIIPGTRGQGSTPEPRPRDTSLNSLRWRAVLPQTPWPTCADSLAEGL